MHIALLGPVAPPAGGVQSHISALKRRITAAGHRATLVAITKSDRRDDSEAFYAAGPAALLKALQTLQPDIVHLHIGGDLTARLFALCAIVGNLPGTRSVLTFHSGGFPKSSRGQSAKKWSWAGWSMRQLDAIIAVNPEIAALFERYGVAPQRVAVISPYARIEPDDVAATVPDVIERFFETHSPVFLAVGLLEPEYSLELQIAAMSQFRARWPSAGLLLVGSGSLRDSLARQVSGSPVSDHILITDNLNHSTVLHAVRRADVLLRTTKFDGDALSVREALQLGTLVVASSTALRPPGVYVMPELTIDSLIATCENAFLDRGGTSAAQNNEHGFTDEIGNILAIYERLIAPSP